MADRDRMAQFSRKCQPQDSHLTWGVARLFPLNKALLLASLKWDPDKLTLKQPCWLKIHPKFTMSHFSRSITNHHTFRNATFQNPNLHGAKRKFNVRVDDKLDISCQAIDLIFPTKPMEYEGSKPLFSLKNDVKFNSHGQSIFLWSLPTKTQFVIPENVILIHVESNPYRTI